MSDTLSAALMIIGATFMLLAGVGIVRMPDLFTRMQTTTKAATLGIGCMLTSSAIYFGKLEITARALAVIVFVFLTAPVAAHMIARAAYFIGVPLWKGTIRDDLQGHYDLRTHVLEGTGTLRFGPPSTTETDDSGPSAK
jgi:multicomponent Na+:H+ antiporter subunit G